jgi:hypothetical protein
MCIPMDRSRTRTLDRPKMDRGNLRKELRLRGSRKTHHRDRTFSLEKS